MDGKVRNPSDSPRSRRLAAQRPHPHRVCPARAQVDGAVTYVQGAYETRVLPSRPVQAALELKSKLAASHPDNVELFKKARRTPEIGRSFSTSLSRQWAP